MYSWLSIQDEKQFETLTCLTPDLQTGAIRSYVGVTPMDENIKLCTFAITETVDGFTFDYLENSVLSFVSVDLANFLAPKINAEFLPVEIEYPAQFTKRYVLMHLFDRIDAIDREQSDFSEHSEALGGGISRVRKLVLNETLINGKPAFVLNELCGIFFRRDLCEEIEAAGFKGLGFEPSEVATFGV